MRNLTNDEISQVSGGHIVLGQFDPMLGFRTITIPSDMHADGFLFDSFGGMSGHGSGSLFGRSFGFGGNFGGGFGFNRGFMGGFGRFGFNFNGSGGFGGS